MSELQYLKQEEINLQLEINSLEEKNNQLLSILDFLSEKVGKLSLEDYGFKNIDDYITEMKNEFKL
jgi:hypothetical protein